MGVGRRGLNFYAHGIPIAGREKGMRGKPGEGGRGREKEMGEGGKPGEGAREETKG